MLLFRLLGFARLDCGCLVGRYHQLAIDRDVQYVEEKGCSCAHADHQRNLPVAVTAHGSSNAETTAVSAAS